MSEVPNDLGRATSPALTEIRTVHSRAATALRDMKHQRYQRWYIEPPQPMYDENNKYVGWSEGTWVPHPGIDQMIEILDEFVFKLAEWERTGTTKFRG